MSYQAKGLARTVITEALANTGKVTSNYVQLTLTDLRLVGLVVPTLLHTVIDKPTE